MLPWVAVRGGRPRSLVGEGSPESDLDEVLRAGLKAYGRLLLWDLNGIERGDPQLEIYRRFEGKGLWVDAGARTLGTLVDVLVAGAEIAVVHQRRMGDVSQLAEAQKLTPQLALCVEETPELAETASDTPLTAPVDLFRGAFEAGIERGVYLKPEGLHEVPSWVSSLEGMELYAGPVSTPGGEPQAEGRVIADLLELV